MRFWSVCVSVYFSPLLYDDTRAREEFSPLGSVQLRRVCGENGEELCVWGGGEAESRGAGCAAVLGLQGRSGVCVSEKGGGGAEAVWKNRLM